MTVAQPRTTDPPCEVKSPILAAILLPINTVALPIAIESTEPTQTDISPTQTAGRLPISTVDKPGPEIAPPTWGTVPVTIGHKHVSPTLAAKLILIS